MDMGRNNPRDRPESDSDAYAWTSQDTYMNNFSAHELAQLVKDMPSSQKSQYLLWLAKHKSTAEEEELQRKCFNRTALYGLGSFFTGGSFGFYLTKFVKQKYVPNLSTVFLRVNAFFFGIYAAFYATQVANSRCIEQILSKKDLPITRKLISVIAESKNEGSTDNFTPDSSQQLPSANPSNKPSQKNDVYERSSFDSRVSSSSSTFGSPSSSRNASDISKNYNDEPYDNNDPFAIDSKPKDTKPTKSWDDIRRMHHEQSSGEENNRKASD